jgi:hypothetical protein
MVTDREIQEFLTKIKQVRQELADIDKQMAFYEQRKAELERIIQRCNEVCGIDQPQQTPFMKLVDQSKVPSPIYSRTITKKRKSKRAKRGGVLWKLLGGVLENHPDGLIYKQIKQICVEKGWITDDANGTKILYRALRDKEGKNFAYNPDKKIWKLKE